jgi:hypothetical protein
MSKQRNWCPRRKHLSCCQRPSCDAEPDENAHHQLGHRNDATGTHAAIRQQLHSVIKPLVKSACSARGKRHYQDAPGVILANAISSLPVHNTPFRTPSVDVLLSTAHDVAALLMHGTLSTDVAGSYKVLQAAWERLHLNPDVSTRTTRMSLLVVLKALNRNTHWTVRHPWPLHSTRLL